MNPSTRRHLVRSNLYLFIIVACSAGLLWGTNVSSSSGSRTERAEDRAESELFMNNGLFKQLLLQTPLAKVAPRVLSETADGKSTPVVIMLSDQADVSAAESMKDQDARGWYVYNTLTEHAARTQVELKAFLKSQGVSYKSFWAANMLVV